MEEKRQELLRRLESRRNDHDIPAKPEITHKIIDQRYAEIDSAIGDLEKRVSTHSGNGDSPSDLLSAVSSLQSQLSDYSAYFAPYTVRSLQKKLSDLNSRIVDTIKSKESSKKKFGFSRKPKPEDETDGRDQSDESKPPPESTPETPNNKLPDFKATISGKSGETLNLSRQETSGKEITFSDLDSCKISIQSSSDSLRFVNVKNCDISAGPTATSVFIDSCADTSFSIACQQLRVHNSTNLAFNLHVTSGAIIENVRDSTFSAYRYKYDGIDEDFQAVSLDPTPNDKWKQVQDFDFPFPGVPSPNFRVIE